MKRVASLAVILSLLTACSACKVRDDSSTLTAYDAGDLSVVLATEEFGWGRGLAGVSLTEGGRPLSQVRVIVPRVSCAMDSCIQVAGVRKDGGIVPLGAVAKGENSLTFEISRLVGEEPVGLEDGGPYRILIDAILDVGPDGAEYRRFGKGMLYVTILKQGYQRLACGGPDVAFIEKVGRKCEVHYSAKFRSALCGEGCQAVPEIGVSGGTGP